MKQPHLISLEEFDENKQDQLMLHAWAVRDLLEGQVRQFIHGRREKPTKEQLIQDFINYYKECLPENKGYLKIGLCYALLSREGNYIDKEPLYDVSRNINCNMSFDDLLKEVGV